MEGQARGNETKTQIMMRRGNAISRYI